MREENNNLLLPHHVAHLIDEGFTSEQIQEWIKQGALSVSEEQARKMGFKVWDGKEWKSGSGIYLPFTPDFGQLRLDQPLVRENGNVAKYLTPCKKKTQAYIPNLCIVITEGIKDALAGCWFGKIPTGALAGVSHYRKALPLGAGFVVLFDSDGWHNPQVFRNLFNAGLWVNGKVQILPIIPGLKKAGLCEYFKAGHTAEDYKKLIDSAYTPKELLMEWPRHWDGMPDKRLSDAIKVALSLAAEYLDEIEQEEYCKRIKKATGFSIKKIRCLFQKAANKVNTKTSDSSTKKLDNQQLYDFITTKYGSRLRLNILGQKIELDGEELDLDAAYIHLLKYEGIDASKYFVADVFKDVARQNPYSPVTEYLDQVSQIAIPVNFDHLCSRYFGTNNPLFNLFLKKTLIAAVARAYDPGCKVDTALVLQGKQGMGKSSFFKVLGGKWFDDSMGDGRDKDDLLILDKCWIQEWSEIERVFGRRQAGELKAFLSRNIDNFREPYGRCTKEFPRHSIIVGTVNNAQFLIDITGNRRYWVIPVLLKAIDLEMLRRERDGIWAAAVQAYKAGETWWLSQEEEAICEVNNEQFRVTDEWETMVANYLEEKERVSIAEILERCFNYEPGKMERSAQMRVANILPSLGWKKVGIKQYQGKRQQCWEKELPVESDYFSTASEAKVNSNFSRSNFVTSQPTKMTEVVQEVVQLVPLDFPCSAQRHNLSQPLEITFEEFLFFSGIAPGGDCSQKVWLKGCAGCAGCDIPCTPTLSPCTTSVTTSVIFVSCDVTKLLREKLLFTFVSLAVGE